MQILLLLIFLILFFAFGGPLVIAVFAALGIAAAPVISVFQSANWSIVGVCVGVLLVGVVVWFFFAVGRTDPEKERAEQQARRERALKNERNNPKLAEWRRKKGVVIRED